MELRGHAGGGQCALDAGLEAPAKSVEPIVGSLVQLAQDGQPSGHGKRISGKRASLVHRTFGRDLLHDHALSAEHPERQAAAHDLAQAGHVRAHTEKRLGTAAADPEARNDLVEDQQRTYASHIWRTDCR